nr:LuxR C-terminal-related transcriptional regulator [Nocardia alni]
MRSARVITLIGPGGIGKTRLAEQATRQFHAGTRVPVFWARLARVTPGADCSAIEEEVARPIVGTDFSDRSSWDALVAGLRRTDAVGRHLRVILVLDNCEHIVDASSDLIARLVVEVPGLTIVVTSREPIGWIDEYVVRVPPLSVDDAAELFMGHMKAAGYDIPEENAPEAAVIRQICRHVNNNPLYISLAAARLADRSLGDICRELGGDAGDTRLAWDSSAEDDGDARSHRMVDVLDWSYSLCGRDERLLLERLSIFAPGDDSDYGGVAVDTIAMVCADEAAESPDASVLAPGDMDDLLETLTRRSLVNVNEGDGEARYFLPECVRVYARNRLRERPAEVIRIQRRHGDYYRRRLRELQRTTLPADENMVDWIRKEWNDIALAVEAGLQQPEDAVAVPDIAVALFALGFPLVRGRMRELRNWSWRLLPGVEARWSCPPEVVVMANNVLSWLAACQREYRMSAELLDQAVRALPGGIGAPEWRHTTDIDIGLPPLVEYVWATQLLMSDGDPAAVVVAARARRKMCAAGNANGAFVSGLVETLAYACLGSPDVASERAQRQLDEAVATGIEWLIGEAEQAWAIAALRQGDPDAALAAVRRAGERQRVPGDYPVRETVVEIEAWVTARILADGMESRVGDQALASRAIDLATLAGRRRRACEAAGIRNVGEGYFNGWTERAFDIARQVLGASKYAGAEETGYRRATGSAWTATSPAVVGMAAEDDDPSPEASRWGRLTSTERHIAVLAAAGWSNTAIAGYRGKSFRTVNTQMAAVFQKLMIHSRREVVAHIPAELMEEVNTARARKPSSGHTSAGTVSRV